MSMWLPGIPTDIQRLIFGGGTPTTAAVSTVRTPSAPTGSIEPWSPGTEFWIQIRDIFADVWDLIDWGEIIEAVGEYVWPTTPGAMPGVGVQKVYNGVFVERGVIKVPIIDRNGQPRNIPLGITYRAAKKKYQVRRRRKRLTKRDMYILDSLKEAGKLTSGVGMQMLG